MEPFEIVVSVPRIGAVAFLTVARNERDAANVARLSVVATMLQAASGEGSVNWG